MAHFTFFGICCDSKQKLIETCHQTLIKHYPGLQVRWVRIYGKRWAHLYGDTEGISYQSLKIRLNPFYGICIDNPELIPLSDFDGIINCLKERFDD